MPQPTPNPAPDIPRIVIVLGSIAIAVHLLALAALVLAAGSGPWATRIGDSPALAPQFAQGLYSAFGPSYLTPLKFTNNYHFLSNRPEAPGVRLEVKLKDEGRREVATLQFPDKNANARVRYRQSRLVALLADDQTVPPPQGEAVAAAGQSVRTVEIWDPVTPQSLKIRPVAEHLIPRDRGVMRPSDWSRLLAASYARYLCRAYGAKSAEIIRYTREPIFPVLAFMPDAPEGGGDEQMSANFGELPR
jgi:hypothetical protein